MLYHGSNGLCHVWLVLRARPMWMQMASRIAYPSVQQCSVPVYVRPQCTAGLSVHQNSATALQKTLTTTTMQRSIERSFCLYLAHI
eukprot:3882735-Amphidinium_carterae.1